MEKILAGYIRVSTEMQVEKDSLINQEEVISKFAQSKNKGLKIYRDAGISGKNKDRPALQEMLNDVEQGLIEAVVVTRLDRITRSLKDLISLKELFEGHGVSFISITQNLDTSTPMGRFSFYILGLVAQLEREMTAERVAEDMRGRAKRGKWNGGPIPFGFKFDAELKKLVVNPEEARIVEVIYQLYLKRKSFRNVVHSLNSMGIGTRGGKAWASTSIRRILQNPIYYGVLTYNKRKTIGKTSKPRPEEEYILVEAGCEAIISKNQWTQVQEVANTQKKIPPSSKKSQYLLTGLLECQFCATRLYGYTHVGHAKGGKVYQYYRCNGHISKGSAFCPGNTVDAKVVERIISEQLKYLSTKPHALIERAKDFQVKFDQEIKPLSEQQKGIQQSLTRIDNRSQRLIGLYEDELIEKGEFVKRKASLDSEKKFLEGQLNEINQKIFSNDMSNFDLQTTLSSVHNLAEAYEELDFQEKKELLRTLISKIQVGKHHLDCQFFALPKSFVVWSRTDRDSWQPPA